MLRHLGFPSSPCPTPACAVDQLTFWATVIEAVAWPATVLLSVFLLRRQLRELLPRLRNLRYKEMQAEFGEKLVEAGREMAALPTPAPADDEPLVSGVNFDLQLRSMFVAFDPVSAVDGAWRRLLRAMSEALKREGVEEGLTADTITRELIGRNLLPPDAMDVINSLRDLRNVAIHYGHGSVTPDQAEHYVGLVDRMVAALTAPPLEK